MIVKDGTKIELLGWKSPATHGEPSATRNQLGGRRLGVAGLP
jgi:hypothetical protein